MLHRVTHLILTIFVAGAASGCGAPQAKDYVSTRQLAIGDRSAEADQLWGSIQDTLRRHSFALDRVDRRAGVVSTMPETSQHFFEFWRHDVETRRDSWEASLNPIRRWVEVSVARGDDETWAGLSVMVHKERLSSPDRQFNSTGAAYQYFGDNLPSTTGLARVTAEDDRWLDVGRDSAMENHLLRVILRGAGIEASN